MFTSLLQMLDHPKIDIFIHMDAKNKSYDPAETSKLLKYSRVIHTPRIKVSWGAFSQIKVELILLEAATSQGHYEHYHLLSGADLPIQKAEDIVNFFEEHHGAEFVDFQKVLTDGDKDRTKYYFLFGELIGRPHTIRIKLLRKIQRILLRIQKLLHMCRNKSIDFRKGSNWFSITDEFARYVLSKREWIYGTFHRTLCCDEIFLHTILMGSEFRDRILGGAARLIDWKRGGPYTFRMSDLEQIKSSKAMFARKFHPSVDAEIIEKIRELYS